MAINYHTLARLSNQLAPQELREIVRLAKQIEKLEDQWITKIEKFYKELSEYVANYLLTYGHAPQNFNFQDIFVEHWFATQFEAYRSVKRPSRIPTRMAKAPNAKELKELYELWKQKKYIPKKPAKYAQNLKDSFLKELRNFWHKHSEEFLTGEKGSQENTLHELMEQCNFTESDAKTAIRTQTTAYYNDVRREYYDKIPDVTHYLFVAIRDWATTEWCNTRDGLVYLKDSSYLKKETPPCHWNCRSELLPLDSDNSRHKKLIDDKSIRRENNSPKALPRAFKRK